MEPEVHLFILWSNARKWQEEILADLKTRYAYVKLYEITWSEKFIESNFSRFFEKPMNMREILAKYGVGEFLICIAEGNQIDVPTILSVHNKQLDIPTSIYYAIDLKKINRDVTLLFGKNIAELQQDESYKMQTPQRMARDLEGASEWRNLSHVFYVMNNTLSYCVLRNEDTLLNDYDSNEYGDIDLLVENLEKAKYVINGKKYLSSYLYPGMYHVNVAGKNVEFDLAFAGDGYMDKRWENDVLRSARPSPPPYSVVLMTASPMHQYFTLLYHAYVHKTYLSDDYHNKLSKYALFIGATHRDDVPYSMKQLETFMKEHGYMFTIPTQNEGKINWSNLRYVEIYPKLRKKYLVTRKSVSEIRRVLNGIIKRLKR